MVLESVEARYFLRLYNSCREYNLLPCSGGIIDQTEFTIELFDFLDEVMGKARAKAIERHQKKT